MSVFGALYAAVSGLNANSNALGIISDNISNADTVGYKETSTDFSTLVTQSGSPSLYSPGGVQTQPFYNVAQQGVLQAESAPTDLALSGGGFFVVNSSAADIGETSYTRAGAFTVDANGNLVNSAGLYLQGQALTFAQAQAIQNGNYNQLSATTLNSLQTVNVTNNAGAAQPTANISLVANLPANDTSTPETVSVPVYDSLGVSHSMTLTFTPTGVANQWSVSAGLSSAGTSTATIAAGDNIVQFNSDGSLNSAGTTFNAANALSIAWDPTVSSGTSPQKITFDVGSNGQTNGLSQIGTSFTVGQINQDGVAFGSFSGVTVDTHGVVTANYDNGLHRAIYMIPVATFSNSDGLQPISGNSYLETNASGSVLLRQSGQGAAGTISPSSLENSTVDIATEFSNLIITQRAYEANSKIITTADQMLQTLIQAKQ
jgi:flagellar hook protein FlgE